MNIFSLSSVLFVLDFLFPPKELARTLHTLTHDDLTDPTRYDFAEKYPEIYSITRYKDPIVKNLVSEVKFRGNSRSAEIIGAFMAKHVDILFEQRRGRSSHELHQCVILPIPSAPSRKRARGWNQCELIVEHIRTWSVFQPKIISDFLLRSERTTFQKKLSRKERLRAQKDSFTIELEHTLFDSIDFKNQLIIIVDDVVTTGATLLEAIRTLRAHGAPNVIGIAFAH